MDFSNLTDYGNGMAVVWLIFVIEWPVFMLLAWYLEQVISSGTGIRRPWLFPFRRRSSKCASICFRAEVVCSTLVVCASLHHQLLPCSSYRAVGARVARYSVQSECERCDESTGTLCVLCRSRVANEINSASNGEQHALSCSALPSDHGALSDDAVRERNAAYVTQPGDEHPIVLRDLRKVFPKMDGNPAKVAVDNMSIAVASGECFGCACPIGFGGVCCAVELALFCKQDPSDSAVCQCTIALFAGGSCAEMP